MFKITLLFILTLASFSAAAQPLAVTDVKFVEGNRHLNQILITFNQAIAKHGQVPTSAQINAIELDEKLKKQCRWRYQGLNKISCDTFVKTPAYIPTKLVVTKHFVGKGKQINNRFEHIWVNTRFPVGETKVNEYELSVTFTTPFEADQQAIAAILDVVRIKLDHSITKPLNTQLIRTNDTQTKLVFKFKEPINKLNIELVLPQGFKATEAHQATHSKTVLYRQKAYSDTPKFIGLFCEASHNDWTNKRFTSIENASKKSCPPENLAFAFTHALRSKHDLSTITATSLNSHPIKVTQKSQEDRFHFYSVNLKGDTQYQFDFSALTTTKGKHFENTDFLISYKTGKESTYWRTRDYLGKQFKSSESAILRLEHRNALDLKAQYFSATNATKLLNFLNTSNKQSLFTPIQINSANDNTLRHQHLPVAEHLDHASGVVIYNLTGQSSKSQSQSDTSFEDKSIALSASDFELKAFMGAGLYVSTTRFETGSPVQAKIKLVCPNMSKPASIGSTNDDGELSISHTSWLKFEGKSMQNCWLWATSKKSKAVLEIDQRPETKIVAKAVFSQPVYTPNTPIHFTLLAKRHSENGLKTLKNNLNITIHRFNNKLHTPIEIDATAISEHGLMQFELPEGLSETGVYWLEAQYNGSPTKVNGYFKVTEFIPPEVEFDWRHSDSATKLAPFTVQVTGKTFNGFAVQNFSGVLSHQYDHMYRAPDGWPANFEYSDRDELAANLRRAVKTELQSKDEVGELKLKLKPDLPLVQIRLNGTVISETGQSTFYRASIPYFSREHYIGTKQQNYQIDVIAVEPSGKQIQTQTHVNIVHEDGKATELCSGETPFSCKIPTGLSGKVTFKLVSGDNKFTWLRSHYVYPEQSDDELKTAPLEIQGKAQTEVGSEYELNITSNRAGEAFLFINAGEYKEINHIHLVEGSNSEQITISQRHMPGIKVHVFMPFSAQAQAELKSLHSDQLKLLFEKLKSQFEQFPTSQNNFVLPKKPSILGEIASKRINVTPVTPLELKATHAVTTKSNSMLSVTLESNQNTDVQLWLVNDALFDVSYTRAEDVSFKDLYNAYLYELPFKPAHNLKEWMIEPELTEHSEMLAHFASTHHDVQMRRRLASMPPSQSMSPLAQSVWLPPITLQAKKSRTIDVPLPQLIGRWKLFALGANETNHARYEGDITTSAEIEYSLYVPPKVFKNDKAVMRVVATNRTNRVLQDRLDISINNGGAKTYNIELHEQQSFTLDIPIKTSDMGHYQIALKSEQDRTRNQFANYEVLLATYQDQRSVKMAPSQTTPNIMLPTNEKILKSYAIPTNTLAPDWSGLLKYHTRYPHQCWEQTLSRTVSLTNNPMTKETNVALHKTLHASNKHNARNDGYSYFLNAKTDPFLTAYTLLANQWLKDSAYKFNVDRSLIDTQVNKLSDTNQTQIAYKSKLTPYANDWLLWALAEQGEINLKDVKRVRARGVLDSTSNLIQLLAMKSAGGDQTQIEKALERILSGGYQDSSYTSLNSTQDKCLAVMLTERQSLKDDLAKQVISKQIQVGHFGNTLNDALCTRALKNRPVTEALHVNLRAENTHNKVTEYKIHTNQVDAGFYLNIDYEKHYISDKASFNGVGISKKFQIMTDGEWKDVSENEIKVGQLVKVRLSAFSPIPRTHVLITDTLPKGLVALNPLHRQKQYTNWLGESAVNTLPHINGMGQIVWHRYQVSDGVTLFEYLAEARFNGEYVSPAANIELMYTPEINGNSDAEMITIQRK
ncbi:hypothetical protein A7985_24220 [Pseudoalteromonas luteoviolacea]|uniref:Alpha-2-macroglobulin domain-containing protein n=1 Tax=Pseudoalteromonas luteoviolacea TaxID=43657 RepID=A0A1C0TJ26_9GAMM|nr:hypothetical protein [Pseudoalteromonas luteoviolacea]OCQ18318.1 hypothetical protein A7985_24220 [Pseudoalteromonas luteoviolacea]